MNFTSNHLGAIVLIIIALTIIVFAIYVYLKAEKHKEIAINKCMQLLEKITNGLRDKTGKRLALKHLAEIYEYRDKYELSFYEDLGVVDPLVLKVLAHNCFLLYAESRIILGDLYEIAELEREELEFCERFMPGKEKACRLKPTFIS